MSGSPIDWARELGAAITVTDASGTILEMNERAAAIFAASGGAALVGTSVLDCHPPEVRDRVAQLYRTWQPNHYTIRKNGQRKIIHQLPWFVAGEPAGVIEISIPIPDELPHFDRA
jgi:PAS domain-containing protein